jgi:hypothetical protein
MEQQAKPKAQEWAPAGSNDQTLSMALGAGDGDATGPAV